MFPLFIVNLCTLVLLFLYFSWSLVAFWPCTCGCSWLWEMYQSWNRASFINASYWL